MEAIGAHDEPFIPGRPRYDQSTFQGRFRHFLDVADPRCLAPKLFFGMSLDEASAILSTHKVEGGCSWAALSTHPLGRPLKPPPSPVQENPSAKIANDKLWLASKIHTSAIHPDTGEVCSLVVIHIICLQGFSSSPPPSTHHFPYSVFPSPSACAGLPCTALPWLLR